MADLEVFISYRRDTDAIRAVALDQFISGAFNRREKPPTVIVFRDTAQRLGIPWPEEVRHRCSIADIVLVVIGPDWLAARDQDYRRRIDQPDDWVRQEIELALELGKKLIPIAFGGADIPSPTALPESIAGLARWNGTTVRDEYPNDLQPVLREIELVLRGADLHDVRRDIGRGAHRLPYPDPPLIIKPPPMAESDIDIALSEVLQDWTVVRTPLPEKPSEIRTELYRAFEFQTFLDVIKFMREIADFAEKANHHPRWENLYCDLWVYLTTWDIDHFITYLDIQLAQFFDQAYKDYCNSSGS